jgi:uncharacterized protein
MPNLAFANINRPGVTLVESTGGYRNLTIASFQTVYMFGTSASGTANTPTLITSLSDFTNQFGTSPSTKAVRLFFRNNSQGILYFVKVAEGEDAAEQTINYVDAIENTFDYEEDWPQGFIIAPEAFETLETATQRLAVANAMHTLAADKNYDWFAILDCAPSNDTVVELQNEAATYVAPQGHSAYYAPFLTDLESQTVAPSPAIAAIATKRFREEGFHQPFAGAKYPVQGVIDVAVKYGNQEQETLNPLGVNLIRNLRNKGVVCWAMRTRSADPFYRFVNTRIIMNVLNGTLRRGFDFDLFSAIDGQGVLLSRIEETARAVCDQLWRGKALFGNSPDEAYEVVCSFENNDANQLEQGNVLVQVFVAPSPAVEKILINTVRVSLGNVQAAAQSGTQQ